jgi:hypothetical protein
MPWFIRRTSWPLVLVLTAGVVSLAVSVRASLAATHGVLVYAVDDAYIHMAVAKNLAQHGIWGCTPFHFSSSSSSPLWIVLLAATYLAAGLRDYLPLFLNILFAALALIAADYYLRRFSVPAMARCTALIGIAVGSSLTAMVLLGMEHVLHFLLTIWFAGAAAEAITREGGDRIAARRDLILLCSLGALLGSSRYEGFFLVAIVCSTFMLRGRFARAALIAAASWVPAAIFGAISRWNGAFFLPNSLMLKAVGGATTGLGSLLKPIGPGDGAFLRGHVSLMIVAGLGLAAAFAYAMREGRIWRPQVLLPIWLLFAILLHGHFTFSSTYWAYRYDVYLLGFAIFAFAVTSAGLVAARLTTDLTLAAVLVAITAYLGNYREGWFPRAEIAGAKYTNIEHVAIAKFVAAYYPDETIAINDLGALAYYTDAHLVDLVGLGDLEPLLIQRRTGHYTSDDVREWVGSHHARIAILQVDWSLIIPLVPRQWREVSELALPPNGKLVGFFAIDPEEAVRLRGTVQDYFGNWRRTEGYQLRALLSN